jgi:hypothetical protein
MAGAVRWEQFAVQAPEIAAAGRALLYQYGVGLGFLATLRADGAPRLHPVCPVVAEGGLFVFVVNRSPKVHDLRRDPRFALHAMPAEQVDDEFVVNGRVEPVTDDAVEARVLATYLAQGTTSEDHTLFELLVDRALHVPYGPRPSPPLAHHRWQAG